MQDFAEKSLICATRSGVDRQEAAGRTKEWFGFYAGLCRKIFD
ncbi:MAG: hypothetical protein ACK5I7_02410 [Anaerotignum sp.]